MRSTANVRAVAAANPVEPLIAPTVAIVTTVLGAAARTLHFRRRLRAWIAERDAKTFSESKPPVFHPPLLGVSNKRRLPLRDAAISRRMSRASPRPRP
jgi:hypothetical protein